MQHDRDIIYRLLIFTEDVIIFSDINVRYFCDTRTVRIKNESSKNDRVLDFFKKMSIVILRAVYRKFLSIKL